MTTNNRKYIDRGNLLVIKKDEGKKIYEQEKNGRPFQYSDSLFRDIAVLKSLTGILYRACQGILEETMEEKSPGWTIIHARLQSIKINIEDIIAKVITKDGCLTIIIDSTGMEHVDKGKWLEIKWKAPKKVHGFTKLHILIDADTKKILAFRITDQNKGDAPYLSEMLKKVLEEHQGKTVLYEDGAYSSRNNFKICKENKVTAHLKLAKNAVTSGKGKGDARGIAVRHQFGGKPNAKNTGTIPMDVRLKNQKKWKKKVKYGQRWLVEIVFSAFKRIFGSCLYSKKQDTRLNELNYKVAIYNMLVEKGMQ